MISCYWKKNVGSMVVVFMYQVDRKTSDNYICLSYDSIQFLVTGDMKTFWCRNGAKNSVKTKYNKAKS
jgi:hypothetical protein